MKTLLIAHYWHPYNNAGTMRWLHFSKYIDFDVLTTKKPIQSIFDETLPDTKKKTIRFGKNLPAIVWGLLASIRMLFMKYERYIITCPPESLLFGAFVLQLLGKNVIVDMRDDIDRDRQPVKPMIPVFNFLYNRIKNIVVSWKPIDYSKPCVYHGYEIDEGSEFKGYYQGRKKYADFVELMRNGWIPDQTNKPKGYYCSSFHSFKKLSYPLGYKVHDSLYDIEPKSWKERATEMIDVISNYEK